MKTVNADAKKAKNVHVMNVIVEMIVTVVMIVIAMIAVIVKIAIATMNVTAMMTVNVAAEIVDHVEDAEVLMLTL